MRRISYLLVVLGFQWASSPTLASDQCSYAPICDGGILKTFFDDLYNYKDGDRSIQSAFLGKVVFPRLEKNQLVLLNDRLPQKCLDFLICVRDGEVDLKGYLSSYEGPVQRLAKGIRKVGNQTYFFAPTDVDVLEAIVAELHNKLARIPSGAGESAPCGYRAAEIYKAATKISSYVRKADVVYIYPLGEVGSLEPSGWPHHYVTQITMRSGKVFVVDSLSYPEVEDATLVDWVKAKFPNAAPPAIIKYLLPDVPMTLEWDPATAKGMQTFR